MSPDSTTRATPEAAPAAVGSLSVTTQPSRLAVTLLDRKLSVVAQGVSPIRFASLAPGLYMVNASRPGGEDFRALSLVLAGVDRAVRLPSSDKGIGHWLLNVSARALDPFMRRALTPELVSDTVPNAAGQTRLRPFAIRFVRLYDWKHALIGNPLKYSATVTGAQALLDITNPETSVSFAQIAGVGPVRNVALPPGSPGKPARFQLLIDSSDDDLKVRVRLSTDWANSALQYMTQGYLEQARLVATGASGEASATGAAAAPALAYDDAAAALVPRYLGLRLRDPAIFNSSQGVFVEAMDRLSDGLILTAELAARNGQYRPAANSLLKIRPGSLPLFTEGYSLLVQRLRELPDLDDEDIPEDQRLQDDLKKRLRELRRAIGRWAAYIDLDSPTLVFPGEDLAKPSRSGAAEEADGETASKPAVAGTRDPIDGWIPIGDSIVTSIKGAFTMSTGSSTGSLSASASSWPELGPLSTGTGSGFPVGLIQEIDKFVAMCGRNYRFNSRADTALNLTGIALSVGIVVAGVLKRSDYATVLGAVMAATVTAQRAFPFNLRWQFYRTLWSQAQNLATRAKSGSLTAEQAVTALANLRLDFAQQIPRGSVTADVQKSDDHPQSAAASDGQKAGAGQPGSAG